MDPYPTWDETPDQHVRACMNPRATVAVRDVEALLDLTGDDWVVGVEIEGLRDAGIVAPSGSLATERAASTYSELYDRFFLGRSGMASSDNLWAYVEVGLDTRGQITYLLLPAHRSVARVSS